MTQPTESTAITAPKKKPKSTTRTSKQKSKPAKVDKTASPGKGNRSRRFAVLTKPQKEALLKEVLKAQGTPDFQKQLLTNLHTMAKHYGFTALAQKTSFSREAHYIALKPSGNPSVMFLFSLLRTLGVRVNLVISKATPKNQASISKAMEYYNFQMLKTALRTFADDMHGLKAVALDAEMCRTSIYRMVGDQGNPSTKNFIKILNAVDGKLTFSVVD